MRALISIFKVRFQLFLQYRMAAIAGMFTQFFFGFVMIMIFEAFFKSTTNIMPMTFRQTVSYIWLGQSLLGLIPWNGDSEMQTMIRNGDFAYELVRPLNIWNYWYYRMLAQRLAPTLLKAIPLIIIVTFLPEPYSLRSPVSVEGALYFAIILIGAIVLGCALSNLITISYLFTIGNGIDRLLPAFVTFFSGMIIPLSFLPNWSQEFVRLMPFSGLVDTPYKFYLGIYTKQELLYSVLHQVTWTLIFMVLGKYLISRASKRIIVQGG